MKLACASWVEKESERGPHLFYYVRRFVHRGLAALAQLNEILVINRGLPSWSLLTL